MAEPGSVTKARPTTPKPPPVGTTPKPASPVISTQFDVTALRQWHLTDADWTRFEGLTRPVFTWADAVKICNLSSNLDSIFTCLLGFGDQNIARLPHKMLTVLYRR
eukprot:8310565-Heterocapsa_arctica.AAC.1